MDPANPYASFARRIVEGGIVTDPWLGGAPRFREAPLVLSAAEARAMSRAAEALCEVYNELCLLVSDDPEVLGAFFGLTAWQRAMWLASQPMWHGIARADLFVTGEGLAVAELNCDTPTGEAEAIVLGALAIGAGEGKYVDPNAELGARIVDVAEALAGAGGGAQRRAGIVYPTELPEDLSLVRLYKRVFEARGWEIVLGSPYNLTHSEGRLRLFGQPISLVLRHYKTDWWGERESAWSDEELADPAPLDEPLEAVLRATLEGSCAVMNPFGAIVPQNKRAMAFMWEQIHRFSRRSQDVIRELVPVTRRLEAVHREQLEAQKDEWVLKSDYGAEGDEVVVGRFTSADVWRASLVHARPGRWVVQRYFQARTGPEGETVNHGVFLLGGEARGIYARAQVGPTDERALSVPVLVEG